MHGRTDGPAGERLYGDDKGKTEKEYAELPRPAVVKHPVTGRPILFVNPMHIHGFAGMEREAAWQLIEELAAHSTQDRFTYYHSWQVGDLLMWDERATMHRGAGDSTPTSAASCCARSSTRIRAIPDRITPSFPRKLREVHTLSPDKLPSSWPGQARSSPAKTKGAETTSLVAAKISPDSIGRV